MSFLTGLSPNFEKDSYSKFQRLLAEPQEEPGFFEGSQSQIGKSIYRGLGVEPAIVGSLALSTIPLVVDDIFDTEITDLWHKKLTEPLVKERESLLPRPEAVGLGTQIVDALASLLPQAILFGPVATGIITGTTEATEQIQQGKDLLSSLELGGLTGAVNAAGIKIPAAFSTEKLAVPLLAQRLTSGAVVGTGLGAAAEEGRGAILREGGYHKEAKNYRWDNPETRTIDLILNLAFAGVAHVSAKSRPTQEQIDAAATINDANHVEQLIPIDHPTPQEMNAHVALYEENMARLLQGEPLKESLLLRTEAIPEGIPESLIALSGNRMTRGERQLLEREKADLDYKIKQIEQGDYSSEGARLVAEQQAELNAVRDLNRVPRRKLAAERKALPEKERIASEAARKNDLETLQDRLTRVNELQLRDEQAQSAHAEISRIQQKTPRDYLREEAIREDIRPLIKEAEAERPVFPEVKENLVNEDKPILAAEGIHESPELTAAKQAVDDHGDFEVSYRDENDIEQKANASQLLDELNSDMKEIDKVESAYKGLITCFFSQGE